MKFEGCSGHVGGPAHGIGLRLSKLSPWFDLL